MKRKVLRFLYSELIIFMILGILALIFYKRFVVNPPLYTVTAPKDIKEAQVQDLDYLALYTNYDRSFDTKEKKTAFQDSIEVLRNRLPVSKAAFEMAIAKIAAIADNAHSNPSPRARAKRLNAVPLRFHWFQEGLYVILAQSNHSELLGSRVQAINGIDPAELLNNMKPWYGGEASSLRAASPLYFMSPDVLHSMGFGNSSDSLDISFLKANGQEETRIIQASDIEKDIPGYWVSDWLNPYEKIASSDWKSCIIEQKLALPFKKLEYNVHHEFIGKTLYVQLNENWNSTDRKVKKYLKPVIQEAKNKELDAVIFDLRFNPGGNYHLGWPFIKAMRDHLKPDKKFYIVTGNGTFSAGLITAAYANYQLGERALVIGEPVGDRLQFWADGGLPMILPNSRVALYIWTAYSDWENGCKDWSKCFWITIFDGVATGKFELDKEVPLSFHDYINGKDSVLDYILSL